MFSLFEVHILRIKEEAIFKKKKEKKKRGEIRRLF